MTTIGYTIFVLTCAYSFWQGYRAGKQRYQDLVAEDMAKIIKWCRDQGMKVTLNGKEANNE